MPKTNFESHFVGSPPLFPHLQDRTERPLQDTAVIERFFAVLVDGLAKEGAESCQFH